MNSPMNLHIHAGCFPPPKIQSLAPVLLPRFHSRGVRALKTFITTLGFIGARTTRNSPFPRSTQQQTHNCYFAVWCRRSYVLTSVCLPLPFFAPHFSNASRRAPSRARPRLFAASSTRFMCVSWSHVAGAAREDSSAAHYVKLFVCSRPPIKNGSRVTRQSPEAGV